jgi:hypothetical protein
MRHAVPLSLVVPRIAAGCAGVLKA